MSRHDRNVRLLFGLAGASTAAILPFFVLWLRSRGMAPDRIGFVVAASALAAVVAAPVWSHAADMRLGTTRALVLSSAATAAAALLLLAVGPAFWPILVMVVAMAVAGAPGTALSDSLALNVLGPERETQYGSVRLWASLGWAGAVIVFGAWYQHAGLGAMLPLYAALTLIVAMVAATFPPFRGAEHPKHPTDHTGERLGAVGQAFRASTHLAPFLAGLFLVSTANAAALTFVPLRIASDGRGPFLVGLAAGVAAMVEVPFFASSRRLGARFGQRTLYVAGAGIYVAIFLGYGLAADPVTTAVLRALSGAGFGLLYAAMVVIAGRLVPPALRNTGQALTQTVNTGIGPIVGSALGGLVFAHAGPRPMFLGAAACAAVGAVVVWSALSGPAFSTPGAEAGRPRTAVA